MRDRGLSSVFPTYSPHQSAAMSTFPEAVAPGPQFTCGWLGPVKVAEAGQVPKPNSFMCRIHCPIVPSVTVRACVGRLMLGTLLPRSS
jgi:hypothetical protein